jgi:hypothetical protein
MDQFKLKLSFEFDSIDDPEDRKLNQTQNLILESAAESNFQKLKIWF